MKQAMIDVSDINGYEFADEVIKSKSPMMIIVGENENPIIMIVK